MSMPGKPEIIIRDNPAQLAITAADVFRMTAKDCVTQKGRFAVALSGGSTPRRMHRMLAEEPYYSDIPWYKTHIFWVDERCVPEDNPASNYGLAKKDFLDQIPIPVEQIHPMPREDPPEKGARKYRGELEAFFQIKEEDFPVFDLIFLGVGKDGHTASLFPEESFVEASERWVAAVKGGTPDVYRLTLAYDILNRAKEIYFLVSGEGKGPIVKSIFERRETRLPAQKIQPLNGRLTWLLDKEAASLLSGDMTREGS